MTIAILAMQGAFLEHGQMLDRLGVDHFEIRKKEDLNRHFDGLILPGGESTVMRKLLIELDIYDTLKQKIEDGLPVFGTCAGLILLAERVEDGVPCFGTMNILAKRNALRDYDNLWNYAKELYSIPEYKEFADFEKIKQEELLGTKEENPYQIVGLGPDESYWNEPNNRAEKFA